MELVYAVSSITQSKGLEGSRRDQARRVALHTFFKDATLMGASDSSRLNRTSLSASHILR